MTPELAEKVLRGGPDAIAVVRGIYQSHIEKLDALESQARQMRDAAALLPLVWIPVSERVPQEEQRVLVWSQSNGLHIAYIDLWGQWRDADDNPGKKITHWMPLPSPPDCAQTGET